MKLKEIKPEFKATKENLKNIVKAANNISSKGVFVDSEKCTGPCTPYEPKGICSPMQPIGSCINCGNPKTQ